MKRASRIAWDLKHLFIQKVRKRKWERERIGGVWRARTDHNTHSIRFASPGTFFPSSIWQQYFLILPAFDSLLSFSSSKIIFDSCCLNKKSQLSVLGNISLGKIIVIKNKSFCSCKVSVDAWCRWNCFWRVFRGKTVANVLYLRT